MIPVCIKVDKRISILLVSIILFKMKPVQISSLEQTCLSLAVTKGDICFIDEAARYNNTYLYDKKEEIYVLSYN